MGSGIGHVDGSFSERIVGFSDRLERPILMRNKAACRS